MSAIVETPRGWTSAPLKDVAEKIVDGSHNPPPKQESGFPMLSAKNVAWGSIDFDGFRYITKDAFELERKRADLKPDDVLLTIVGTIGRAAVIPESAEKFALQRSVAMIRPKGLNSKFVMFQLLSERVQKWLRDSARGSAQQGVYLKTLGTLPMLVAPDREQRRIVAEIEKQFTRLEAGVAALRRVQANLKRYRAAVLKAACEGQLVPTEAELHRQRKTKSAPLETGAELLTRILAERRKNWTGRGQYKEPAAPNTTNLGPLPEGWTWATFEQISERVTVGFVGSMKHEYVENGVPFLRGQNVRENRFDPEGLLYVSPKFHQTLSKSALRPGDLAVVRSGSVGVTCVIPDSLPDANCADLVLIQRPLGFVPQYGAYYMNSLAKRHVAAGKVGVALIHFNTKSVAALAVPLPPLAEQTRIVAEVERRLSVVEELESVVSANLQRATRLRQSILQKAFTGELLS